MHPVVSTPPRAELAPPVVVAERSGVRSGALLAAASGASILANYVFLLAAGRILGGDAEGAARFAHGTLIAAGVATVPLVVLALALVAPLKDLLNIGSTGAVGL